MLIVGRTYKGVDMSAREEMYIMRGLARRFNNLVFGYKKRKKSRRLRRKATKK